MCPNGSHDDGGVSSSYYKYKELERRLTDIEERITVLEKKVARLKEAHSEHRAG